MPVKDKKKKTRKVTDSSNKATSKSTVIIINEKPKRKRRNTKRKTETTQILQPIHVHQPYYFNPYEFHYPQTPQKVMEVNRQTAIDTLDQNKSEEVKATLVSLGLIPPRPSPQPSMLPLPGSEAQATEAGATPLEPRITDTTPKQGRRLSINPLYQEPFSSGFTVSETPSISSEGYQPNLVSSEIHAIGSYTPGKLDKLRKKFNELEAFAGTPGKKAVYNPNLLKISKEIVETFGDKNDSKKIHDLVKKTETGTRANYKQLELEVREFLSKDHNLTRANPRITSTSLGAF
jgi:hypothetical protein